MLNLSLMRISFFFTIEKYFYDFRIHIVWTKMCQLARRSVRAFSQGFPDAHPSWYAGNKMKRYVREAEPLADIPDNSIGGHQGIN